MTTLQDVAKLAGLSMMTVSRYINNSGYVGEKSREKIKRSIKELNYRPNIVARSLVTKNTKTIGLIIASITNPFYPEIVLGVEDEINEMDYNVILCNADGKMREQEYIEVLLDKCVDGIIFSHLNISAKQILELKNYGVNCVLIDNETKGLNVGKIETNDVIGGNMAGNHLIKLGHKRIGIIHGSLGFNEAKANKKYSETYQFKIWNDRMKGFLEAMETNGIDVDSRFVVEGDGTAENGVKGGYKAMTKILNMLDRPTAIYAENDLMALGAMNAIHEAGFKIPKDFSIIGHDGIALGEMIYPMLTTLELPRYEIGKAAARILMEMENGTNENSLSITFNPKLVIRETTGYLNL